MDLPDSQVHESFGAHLISPSEARFCVWAVNRDEICVLLPDTKREVKLTKTTGGYHVGTIENVRAGDSYFLKVDGGDPRPDPASRFQPDGVHGASQVVDRDFEWTDHAWTGLANRDMVIYELHLGAFTDQGTYLAAIDRLDELVDLGITAIEIMPLAACAGKWNWGYDGVQLFAPSANYGTPDELREFVNEAHKRGLAVILDVVYNHLGPEGNYLGEFGDYFSGEHTTPWGDAPNFDDPNHSRELRRFFVANALMWVDEYHIDGLRVDAIHCMRDESETHIAMQISDAIREWSNCNERAVTLIAESNVYDPNMLAPRAEHGVGFDAEWCDDFLHGVFAVLRPGEHLCHRHYKPSDLEQTLQYGFVYEGTLKGDRGRQSPTQRVDTSGLIYSIQHHDFIGNHPLGKRLHQIVGIEAQKSAAALLLLSPGIPMLFMGEEFACEQPFQFFVDFGDQHLRDAVVQGRMSEYPQHDWAAGRLPTDPEAFLDSKIGAASDGNQEIRAWYTELLAIRKKWITAGLICDQNFSVETNTESNLYVIRYQSKTSVGTVAVRLGENLQDNDQIDFRTDGELLLDSRLSRVFGSR